jgi:uncharacterized DUF497 family protein
MDIGFVWDEDKYQTVQREHGVRFYEVVSVFEDLNGYIAPDPAGHEDRWMWVGQTISGRILSVIYSEEELPLHRIITAFDADDRFINEYYERQGIPHENN